MLYIAVAAVLVALIFSYKPPTFNLNFHKTFEIIQQPLPFPGGLNEQDEVDDLKDLNKKRPPNMDDVMTTVNSIIHGFEQETEEVNNE